MSSLRNLDPKQLQKAESFFQHGHEAALKGNNPYAINLYTEACKLAPGMLKYRQALRGVERRKFQNDPSKVGMFAGAKLQPIRLRIRAARNKGQWEHVLEVCEEAFVQNPWDVGASGEAAEAALQLDLGELAQWLLESVQAQAGNDAHFWRHLARIHQHNKNWQKAIHCWERVKQLVPNDEEPSRQINALSASAAIARSGLEAAIDESGADEQAAVVVNDLPPEAEILRQQTLGPEERFEQEIREQPNRPRPYLELADHYKLQNRLDQARDVLARGLKALPDDSVLRDAYAEIQIARLRHAIDAWTKRARQNPADPEARSKLQQLTAKLHDYEIAEFRRRVAARPEDAQLHFELGQRLARAGQHDAAIAEFQQARSNPHLKVKALLQAGLSFEASGVPKLAERSYQDALKATESDDIDLLNELNYRLGRVHEAQGDFEAAESHYNEVAANNYAYLDVAQRLRSLNQR